MRFTLWIRLVGALVGLVFPLTRAAQAQGPCSGGQVCGGCASATLTFGDTENSQVPPWMKTLTVPAFDPTLGALAKVEVIATAPANGFFQVENLDPIGGCFGGTWSLTTTLNVTRQGGGLAIFSDEQLSVSEVFGPLAPYDGSTDYRGPSGQTHPFSQTFQFQTCLDRPSDLTGFIATSPGQQLNFTADTAPVTQTQNSNCGFLAIIHKLNVGITLSVTYTYCPNEPPQANPDQAATCEGQPVNIPILANDFDPDGTIACNTIEITQRPAHGTVAIGSGCTGNAPCPGCFVTYTPAPGFTGNDSFSYRVRDDGGCFSNQSKVSVLVRANPIAAGDSAQTCQGTAVQIPVLVNDFDPDGTIDCGSITIVVPPQNGTVTIGAGCTGAAPCPTCTLSYTPGAGFSGMDQFQYTVRDTHGCVSAPATVQIDVSANPVAANDAATTCQGIPVNIPILANDFDPDGQINCGTIVITTPPANGTVVIGAGCTGLAPCAGCVVTYTPNAGYVGPDLFRYRVRDNRNCQSNTANVNITVQANPVGGSDTASTCQGVPVAIPVLANDFDPDGTINCGSLVIVTPPANGTVVVGGGCAGPAPCPGCNVTYTPTAAFFGTDGFTYRIADQSGCLSAPIPVTVNVSGRPIAQSDQALTCQGTAVQIPVLSNDFDPDGAINCASIAITTPPAHGTVTIGPGCTGTSPCPNCNLTYTPAPGYFGPDSFQYTVADTLGCTSAPATVSIDISANPIAGNDTATTCQGVPVAIPILANDTDPDGQIDCGSIVIVTGPSSGTLSIGAGCTGNAPCPGCNVTYTPGPGFFGGDSFTYRVRDNRACLSNIATVAITVRAAPVAANDTALTCQAQAVQIPVLANDVDPDSAIDCSSITIVTPPSNGTVVIGSGCTGTSPCNGCVLTYTPTARFFGPDLFRYTVRDVTGCTSNIATVNITVNGNPVATDDRTGACQDTPIDIDVLANDFDPEGTINCGSIVITSPPRNGTVVILPGCSGPFPCPTCRIRYTPDPGFTGEDIFRYRIADLNGCLSQSAIVRVLVDVQPAVADDEAFTCQGQCVSIDILGNDTSGISPADIVIVQQPSHGALGPPNPVTGVIEYCPTSGFCGGFDEFRYQIVSDTACPSDVARVRIRVSCNPIAQNDFVEKDPANPNPIVIDVLANDSDPDGFLVPSSVTVISGPSHGTILGIDRGTGAITYQSGSSFTTCDSFTYRVLDNEGCPATATVQICLRITCPETVHRRKPGALLLYPEFDNRAGVVTIGSVTNTKTGPGGDVRIKFTYRSKTNCAQFDRLENLTPNDTFSFVTNVHNPNQVQGYFYIEARCPQGSAPIAFNHLIGNLLVVDGIETFSYSVNPVSFQGIGQAPSPSCPGYNLTNVDGDSIRDLNGIEYSQAPDEILVPRFLGQSDSVRSQLVLINLTGGPAFTTTVDFLIYDDNENAFSKDLSFYCWTKLPLLQISGAFSNQFLSSSPETDPSEIFGDTTQEAGWFRIDGAVAQSTATAILDPAFYAVLIECVDGDRCVADLPFELCTQDNGDLLPGGVHGDLTD